MSYIDEIILRKREEKKREGAERECERIKEGRNA